MQEKVGCEACGMTGWIYIKREVGQPAVRPCTCRYEIAKRIIMIEKAQTPKEIQDRKAAEEIVRAYEHHKKREENNNAD